MALSKSAIDRSGKALSSGSSINEEQFLEYDDILDEYRKSHLVPLTDITLKLQAWLTLFTTDYYIAQRLKRKPQILKKLVRLSVRLTQLQDIGGCRIIVENNDQVSKLIEYIKDRITRSNYFKIIRITDYREKGRDTTGYRAVHMVVERNGYKIEVQLRSRIQHYWAESIERTSVIYGYQLKSIEGDKFVLNYFKAVSDMFYDVELGANPHFSQRNAIDQMRSQAEQIIKSSEKTTGTLSDFNDKFIKGMIKAEAFSKSKFHNWLILFNWTNGCFEQWQLVNRDPAISINKYTNWEKLYKPEYGYEVVLIGSSDVSTIQHTHKHYFGIENFDDILERMGNPIEEVSKRKELSLDARLILTCLYKKDFWGNKRMTIDTLKNHYCKKLSSVDEALKTLTMRGLLLNDTHKNSISLNLKKKIEIEQYMGCNYESNKIGDIS